MLSPKEQEILKKIKLNPKTDEEPHECDNKPNPFRYLSLEEMEYLQNHQELLQILRQTNNGK